MICYFEWGELFSPGHEAYLSPCGIEHLHVIHLIFLSVSFICLLEFGVALLRPLGQGQWLHPITFLLLAGYILSVLILLSGRIANPHVWHDTANAQVAPRPSISPKALAITQRSQRTHLSSRLMASTPREPSPFPVQRMPGFRSPAGRFRAGLSGPAR